MSRKTLEEIYNKNRAEQHAEMRRMFPKQFPPKAPPPPPPKPRWHEVLGVTPDASWNEIRGVYKILAKQYHPDRRGVGYDEKMKQINGALQQAKAERKKK